MDRAFAVAVMLPLIGCNIFGSDVSRGYKQDSAWNTAATYTTADVRIITQRVHPVLKTPVVCTEPSPDVAKALSTAIQLQAQGGNDAVNAGSWRRRRFSGGRSRIGRSLHGAPRFA